MAVSTKSFCADARPKDPKLAGLRAAVSVAEEEMRRHTDDQSEILRRLAALNGAKLALETFVEEERCRGYVETIRRTTRSESDARDLMRDFIQEADEMTPEEYRTYLAGMGVSRSEDTFYQQARAFRKELDRIKREEGKK